MFKDHYNDNQKDALSYACMGMHKMDYSKRPSLYPAAFLRKPYAGTSAEPKDNTQQKLHEYDYRKI